ncbi:hypothetical protein FA13DRAFT_1739361 [Coprinellus micaceus]|uniref:Uncharacterized protein n=1 Tax=Coprinellus micaceus TaxID=71717 RepID=A0A4Y7SRS3_COPMI|nr:hypothetical protein FA13DRAFT_1739361 [Coprinellus micaceus]
MDDLNDLGLDGCPVFQEIGGRAKEWVGEAVAPIVLKMVWGVFILGVFILVSVAHAEVWDVFKFAGWLKEVSFKGNRALDVPRTLGPKPLSTAPNVQTNTTLCATLARDQTVPQSSAQAPLAQCAQCHANRVTTIIIRCPARHNTCSECLSECAADAISPFVCLACGLAFGPAELGSLLPRPTVEESEGTDTFFDHQDWPEAEEELGGRSFAEDLGWDDEPFDGPDDNDDGDLELAPEEVPLPTVPSNEKDRVDSVGTVSRDEEGGGGATTRKICDGIRVCIAKIQEEEAANRCSTFTGDDETFQDRCSSPSSTNADVHEYKRSADALQELKRAQASTSALLPEEYPHAGYV